MRAALVTTGGLVLSYGLFSLSRVFDGLPGAAFFFLALLTVPVSLGIAIANVGPRTVGRKSSSRCAECGHFRDLSGDVWVCRYCDVGVAPMSRR